jgi:putative oxygen-independent coproporphyrinogen III oxidase
MMTAVNPPVPASVPDGEPVPESGALPRSAVTELGTRRFGIYVHVPFCVTRCGYCDFNTYTADELGPGASRAGYADTAIDEIRLARTVLAGADLPVETVFFGGGTPTVLRPDDLGRILAAINAEFGLAPEAEITTEANPESVDSGSLHRLRERGFTRISFGMQSARDHVLRVLDRTHTPGRPEQCVAEARDAGFEHINLDLIYGTPGESHEDWQASLDAAIDSEPDHISAYSLIVEDGTRLAARIRRGELPTPDDDTLADRYLMADRKLENAGYAWYEISNWSKGIAARCRHNLLYWNDHHWWGIGPGAHSHIGGTRWWNVKHPAEYAARLHAGRSPAHAREVLGAEEQRIERILLRVRCAAGLPLDGLERAGRTVARQAVADGLADPGAERDGRLVLTQRGRLLADTVVRELIG